MDGGRSGKARGLEKGRMDSSNFKETPSQMPVNDKHFNMISELDIFIALPPVMREGYYSLGYQTSNTGSPSCILEFFNLCIIASITS